MDCKELKWHIRNGLIRKDYFKIPYLRRSTPVGQHMRVVVCWVEIPGYSNVEFVETSTATNRKYNVTNYRGYLSSDIYSFYQRNDRYTVGKVLAYKIYVDNVYKGCICQPVIYVYNRQNKIYTPNIVQISGSELPTYDKNSYTEQYQVSTNLESLSYVGYFCKSITRTRDFIGTKPMNINAALFANSINPDPSYWYFGSSFTAMPDNATSQTIKKGFSQMEPTMYDGGAWNICPNDRKTYTQKDVLPDYTTDWNKSFVDTGGYDTAQTIIAGARKVAYPYSSWGWIIEVDLAMSGNTNCKIAEVVTESGTPYNLIKINEYEEFKTIYTSTKTVSYYLPGLSAFSYSDYDPEYVPGQGSSATMGYIDRDELRSEMPIYESTIDPENIEVVFEN